MDKKKKAPHAGGAKQRRVGQNSAKRTSIAEVARAALGSIDTILSRWVPNGKRQGREYLTTNPTRTAGSFKINTETGLWAGFATQDAGGDLVALVAYLEGASQLEAAKKVAEALGLPFSGGDNGEHGDKRTQSRATQGQRANSARPQGVGERVGQVGTSVSQETSSPILPIPAQAGSPPAAHPSLGRPSNVWCYRTAASEALCYVFRFDTSERKEIRQATYWPDGWKWKGLPGNGKPLYGLERLAARPESPVLVCEGEKAVDAAATLAPDHVATTSLGGASAAEKTDWSPLAGRDVVIWRDADEPGATYAAKVVQEATKSGAASVRLLDLTSFARHPTTGEPRELPKGWDAADALAEGWTPEQVTETLARAPEFLPAPTPTPESDPESETLKPYFEPTDRGVYYHGVGEDRQTKQLVRLPRQWICSALYVEALTRDERGENWGRLLAFKDRDGRAHVWAMPMHLLKGSGEELRGELLREPLQKIPDLIPVWDN